MNSIVALTDGATALCYSGDPERVMALARDAIASWPKDLEIGIELGSGSPTEETLKEITPASLLELRQRLETLAGGEVAHHRIAIHDLAALLPIAPIPVLSEPKPQSPGNKP